MQRRVPKEIFGIFQEKGGVSKLICIQPVYLVKDKQAKEKARFVPIYVLHKTVVKAYILRSM